MGINEQTNVFERALKILQSNKLTPNDKYVLENNDSMIQFLLTEVSSRL